jgi:DNA-directed RNA polymerase I, II, and III subunit RPABC1
MQRLFDIKRTQLQMVRDRGYVITEEELGILTMTLEQFTQYITALSARLQQSIRSSLSRSYLAAVPPGAPVQSILVYYGGKTSQSQKQLPADVMRAFLRNIQEYGFQEAVFITDVPLSSTASNELAALTLVKWQVFFDSDLTYNPTLHVDTPRHELLSEEEKQKVLSDLKVDITKLLLIKVDDPIVRYYGWPVGGVVRIHRDDRYISILTPKSINYRVIVNTK